LTSESRNEDSKVRKSPIPVIVGPTASGKSELGIGLAEALSGEIVSLDSVQVYKGIWIATAKVPLEERRAIPHHLIDIVPPTQNFTAGEYARVASETIEGIEERGRLPILVGGTGFYLRALTKPLFESPPTNAALRNRLIKLREKRGAAHLHRLLQRIDPHSASSLSARDWSRTMRAIEVYYQTGKRLSDVQSDVPEPPKFSSRFRVLALNPPREELYQRINLRADRMFEKGLVEEVESLIKSGVPENAKAFQAHGYRRVVEFLQGMRTREDALEQMKLDTRHYAKRQLTWWRAWPNVKWIDLFGDDPASLHEALREPYALQAGAMKCTGFAKIYVLLKLLHA
jgi:tRNA dimethylallyltransferase